MTTTKDALPELPQRFAVWKETDEDSGAWGRPDQDVFTADQMRDYALAALASKQAEAQAKSEPAALTDAQIEAGAISLGRMWKWEMLEESYRVHYRTRFRDAMSAAIAATQEHKP